MRRRLAGAVLGLATAAAQAGADADRRAGDVLSFALPIGAVVAEAWRGDGEAVRQYTAAFVAGVGATELLKRTTDVERPDGSDDLSFPSGHAARSFAAASSVHRRHGLDAAWPLYAAAVWVGHTRVQADRHRWADIAGAAAVTAAASWWLVEPAGGVQLALHRGGWRIAWSVPLR